VKYSKPSEHYAARNHKIVIERNSVSRLHTPL
jgi:hypothetical protein